MTPMQTLKNNLSTFKALIGDSFKETELNKSSPKSFDNLYNPEYSSENKGVKSDYIRIYSVKFNKEDAYSVAFKFTYIDIPQDKQTIQFSLKVGENNDYFIASEELSVNDFKQKLNKVNTALTKKGDNLSRKDFIETLLLEFTPNHYEKFKKVQLNQGQTNFSKQLKKSM